MVTSYWLSQAIFAVTKLGVADLIAEEPVEVSTLAEQTNAQPAMLYRLLRALSCKGVFLEHPGQKFSHTPTSHLLRKNAKGSLASYALWYGDELYLASSHLLTSVVTGKRGFDRHFGADYFTYVSRHPEASRIFNEAMSGVSQLQGEAVLEAYDFAPFRVVADVGGGEGKILRMVLDRFPDTQGVLFDQAHVISDGVDKGLWAPYAARVSLTPGDFFQSDLPSADAYVMKYILHDWDDEHCVRLLRNLKRSMLPGSRLIILEQVLSDELNVPQFAKVNDLFMHVTFGSKERTRGEFTTLLDEAGFRLESVTPTQYLVSVLDARPNP